MNETHTIKLLAEKDESAFEEVFKTNFKNLHSYAHTILGDVQMAEEMVQNVFFKLWERSDTLKLQPPIAAYLYRAVYNESCNYLKHQKVKQSYASYTKHSLSETSGEMASKKIALSELEQKINKALNELPEQCRTVFQMSRFQELRYQQIADALGISIKTVEAQMGKALKLLRVKLADYLPILLFLINT